MNSVKLYTFTVLCAALASAIFNFASPKKQKKQLEYITGLFLLICIISPFINAVNELKSFDFSPPEAEINEINTDELLKNEFTARLQKIIEQKLYSLGINDADIGIEITISKEGVEIADVLITLPSAESEKAQSAKELIKNELGIDAQIQIAGG
ncbi:MAG: hypothetical protein J5968_00495 [Oscillospiraceae bacterium]|nr:hypothetical protein [Oscillospiraceae bacterium]